jgi:glucose-1-phosphatase
MSIPPKFLYFDLGKVLVDFSVERMLDQMAVVVGIPAEAVREAAFGNGLMRQHETGQLSTREFYEAFCQATATRADFGRLVAAAADIFELNLSMIPLVTQLRQAGYRTGILSNTCETHWEHCFRRYRIVHDGFGVFALSHRIGALKPDAAIYHAAAEMAGCAPEEIFFVDDLHGHVAGARAVGFDAMPFTTAAALADELRQRGIRFNY